MSVTPRLSANTRSTLLIAIAWLAVAPARAQRADENAIAAATDAFGTSVGLQTIGLYSPTSARGFNPTQAGNLRIEGLYFDQQTTGTNTALFSGSDMRIGIAAQSYPFPSPTGIADYKLRTPGESSAVSTVVTRGPFEKSTVQIDSEYPLLENKLSAGLNADYEQGFDYQAAHRSRKYATALLLSFRPGEHLELVPFFGCTRGGEHREEPFVYADGVHSLPLFQQQQLPAQDWTSWGWRQTTAGFIARVGLGSTWSMTAGLFRSVEDDLQSFNDVFIGLRPDRMADHVMDVVPPLRAGSNSGDLRLTRRVTDGAHQHELQFAMRAREVDRRYGGDSVTDYGTSSIDASSQLPEPPLRFSATSRDTIRQSALGVSYDERWKNVGTLGFGVLKTKYSRRITVPGVASGPEHTSPVLPTLSFTAEARHGVTFYGSYTRGLEDSVSAPTNARNRGEPPPATATWQVDGGVRYMPASHVQLLLGVFDIHKPYFNLDVNTQYRQIGEARNRGIEGSATLSGTDGLTVVAGFVLINPEVKRRSPGLGLAGSTPVGPVPGTVNVNIDYAPAAWAGWAASVQWTWLSSRVETDDHAYELPPLSSLNVGVRYSRKLFNHSVSARLDVANLTNTQGLTVSPLYFAVPQDRRNFTLTLAADI